MSTNRKFAMPNAYPNHSEKSGTVNNNTQNNLSPVDPDDGYGLIWIIGIVLLILFILLIIFGAFYWYRAPAEVMYMDECGRRLIQKTNYVPMNVTQYVPVQSYVPACPT